jgi:hypothetical protein
MRTCPLRHSYPSRSPRTRVYPPAEIRNHLTPDSNRSPEVMRALGARGPESKRGSKGSLCYSDNEGV